MSQFILFCFLCITCMPCLSQSPSLLQNPATQTEDQPAQRNTQTKLHRNAKKHIYNRKSSTDEGRKGMMEGWRLTCPAFSMLMRSLGQLFETLKERKGQKKQLLQWYFSHSASSLPEQSTISFKMWMSSRDGNWFYWYQCHYRFYPAVWYFIDFLIDSWSVICVE